MSHEENTVFGLNPTEAAIINATIGDNPALFTLNLTVMFRLKDCSIS